MSESKKTKTPKLDPKLATIIKTFASNSEVKKNFIENYAITLAINLILVNLGVKKAYPYSGKVSKSAATDIGDKLFKKIQPLIPNVGVKGAPRGKDKQIALLFYNTKKVKPGSKELDKVMFDYKTGLKANNVICIMDIKKAMDRTLKYKSSSHKVTVFAQLDKKVKAIVHQETCVGDPSLAKQKSAFKKYKAQLSKLGMPNCTLEIKSTYYQV